MFCIKYAIIHIQITNFKSLYYFLSTMRSGNPTSLYSKEVASTVKLLYNGTPWFPGKVPYNWGVLIKKLII